MIILIFILYTLTFWWGCEFQFDDYAWLHRQILGGKDVLIPGRPIPSYIWSLLFDTFKLNPVPYKLLSVLGHCAVIDVLLRIVRKVERPEYGVWLFAIHPLCVSTVAYPVQFSVILGAVFCGWSFYMLLKKNYIAVLTFWVLACLCKQSYYTFIAVPILWWWFENKRGCWLPLLGLVAGAVYAWYSRDLTAMMLNGSSGLGRLCTEGMVLADAVRMVFMPVNLCVLHDYTPITHPGWLIMWGIVSVLICSFCNRGSFYVFAMIALMASEWTLLNLELFFEHRMYALMAFSCLFLPVIDFKKNKNVVRFILVSLLLICLNLHYQYIWRNQIRLWTNNVRVNPEDYRSHENLGKLLYQSEPIKALYHFNTARKYIRCRKEQRFSNDFKTTLEIYLPSIYNEIDEFGKAMQGDE